MSSSRYSLYVLALTTGMRQSELLGLRWQDVDLELGMVQVRTTLQGKELVEPKTTKFRRCVGGYRNGCPGPPPNNTVEGPSSRRISVGRPRFGVH